MTATASRIPDEVLYDFVTQPQTREQLISSLYARASDATKKHFLNINSHLGPQVYPGQMVIITPVNAQQCSGYEAQLIQAAAIIEKQRQTQTADEAKFMAENYALLANIANSSGAGYGIAVNYFKQHKLQIERLLTRIEQLHVTAYNRNCRFNTNEFFQQRKLLLQQLDASLKTMVGRGPLGLDIKRNNIKQSIGLSTKSLAHQLKDYPAPITGLPGFEKNHAKVRQYSKTLKGAGYVALVLDGVQSAAKVKQACTVGRESECTKSKFSEGGQLVGSLFGGATGGAIGAGVCGVVFAVPSAGTSLLWCGIVFGGIGGFVGGNIASGFAKSKGELIYENYYK